jgi:hypothetical protein
VRVGLRLSVTGPLAPATDRLPPGRAIDAGKVDVLYSLVVGGAGSRPGMRRFHLLYCGGSRIARSLDLEPVLDAFESHSRLYVAARSKRGVFLHAGAVAWRGRVLILPGRSSSGKSTLVAELVEAGASYLSDEFAVIRGERVVPFPKPLTLRDDRASRRPRRPRRAMPREGRRCRSAPVGLIALTEFEPTAAWRPRVLTPGRAFQSLLAHAVPARLATEEVLATLHRLVLRVPVVRVKRGEASLAARRLLDWMERKA